MKMALIVVDIQNDFLPGGALAVPSGDEIIPVINKLMKQFPIVIATQDWHPKDHKSFAVNHPDKKPGDKILLEGLEQILWQSHCVQNTYGAELSKHLDKSRITYTVKKGTDPNIDSYSAFFDNARKKSTGLDDLLKSNNVNDVYVVGLATDYCVKYTVLDAMSLGYKTHLITAGCKGININPNDVDKAINQMRQLGAIIE